MKETGFKDNPWVKVHETDVFFWDRTCYAVTLTTSEV